MFYTGLVNTAIGIGIGFVLFGLAAPPYTSRPYQNLRRVYMAVGGVGGFVVGWSWEGLRQLKDRRDREEAQLSENMHPDE
jgi:hypothetical protein